MQFFKASVLAALVASISALSVTSPAEDAKVDLKDVTVSWSSVSSDPTSFSIQLVNMAVNPPVTINIADNVKTSDGSYKISGVDGVTPGGAYQINLVSKTTNNQGILAQSKQFDVEASSSSSSSSSASASSASASSSSASESSSASASSESAAASSSASAASSSASASASSASESSSSRTASATGSAASATSTGAAASLHLASGAAGLGFVGAIIALFA